MKRLFTALLAFTLLLTACGVPANTPSTSAPTPPAASETADNYPLTLTDQGGRAVTLDKEPERIVSGYYISTSLLIALGAEDKLVGMESNADKRPIYALSAPELIELPNVGSAKEFDLEGCAALDPDLVILPLKLKAAAETLTQLGIPTLLVNPENQTLLNEMITLVGQATGTTERAQQLLDFTATQTARLTESLEGADRPTVYLAGNSSFLSTAGDAMYQSDLIELAGGENVAAALTDTYWANIDYEQLLVWNPEVILLAADAAYTVDEVRNNPDLASCAAVQNDAIYQMPRDAEAWDSPVPSGILGAVWFSSVLHPDLFPQTETDSVIVEFYEDFYDFTYGEN